jgi:hypothetical protein
MLGLRRNHRIERQGRIAILVCGDQRCVLTFVDSRNPVLSEGHKGIVELAQQVERPAGFQTGEVRLLLRPIEGHHQRRCDVTEISPSALRWVPMPC